MAVKEAHQLIKDFSQRKAGTVNAPPDGQASGPASQATASATTPAAGEGGQGEILAEIGFGELEVEDPVKKEAREWAAREMDHVHIVRKGDEFQQLLLLGRTSSGYLVHIFDRRREAVNRCWLYKWQCRGCASPQHNRTRARARGARAARFCSLHV